MTRLQAPFPWFGGKSKVAPIVWDYFGDVDNYVEPFAGSLAVLLGRPATHTAKAETVNDLDRYIVNFWRALQNDPDAVAQYGDSPVNESDLTARHLWLVNQGRALLERCDADPDFYDAKIAGWWVWGLSSWIGSGWCSGKGPWIEDDSGLLSERPHLGNAGQGTALYNYMRVLAYRLRRVRVCCGDWQRVVTNGAMSYGATVGVFLDPPYAADTGRDMTLYNHETDVSAAVREWAIVHGDDRRLRIALCGYADEHEMPDGWHEVVWTARAAYKSARGDQNGNRFRERIWFSPTCIVPAPLFGLE